MADVLTAAVFVPGAPLLIPELTGSSIDPDVAVVRRAAIDAASGLAEAVSDWLVLAAGPADRGIDGVGTFAGFGADVTVRLSPYGDGPADPCWPLGVLVGGWLRGLAAPDITARAALIDPASSPQECMERGHRLREECDAASGSTGLLVVADGATTLTAKAPGGFHADAQRWQDDLVAAVGGDLDAQARVTQWTAADAEAVGIDGRAAYQAALAALDGQWNAETRYAAAPFGVGYIVSRWSRPT